MDDQEQAALIPMEDEKVLCVQCNKVLASMNSAKRHFEVKHQQNQKVRCQICRKVFKNAYSRGVHLIQHHGVSGKMMKNAVPMPNRGPPQ